MRQSGKLCALFLLLPGIALAHTGTGTTSGVLHGLMHPVQGLDHLLAMVAVGLWAAGQSRRALWVVPATFVGMMVMGSLLGFFGVAVPFVETGILASVLVLGLLLAGAFKLPLTVTGLIVGVFAVFHGVAHGAELPATTGATSYVAGFATATAALHLAGVGLGLLLRQVNLQTVTRMGGAAIAMGGVYLAIA
ncbi:MAG: HupE/UreJ family protein [Pseudomonadota bacterium]|nr:hypothetical protein [Pseudomonadales bacterium]MDY6921231.1 HupE/UreJ family protein [Pseudomonadota bacterium]